MLDARAPEPSRLPEPDRERWTVLRAGIQNVWEYDDRRFVFHRGRLLLRGRNEAGKTKAVELLFPFLLDADLAPQRLDPFGSNARPMRWNLINESEPELPQRIGYLWLELGRLAGGAPEYFTIGAGLRARRSASDVEAWFFVTSQRPDRDVRFVTEDRHPLTRGELGEAIGDAGQVFERHADHRRAVNARLFGMPDEQYAALVDMLLHLRRPQLSKALDVEELSGFLSASLPPLDPAFIAPIAEGFERLDHRRADLEGLARVLATLRDFQGVYREYARAVAKGRALDLTRADSAHQKARGEARSRAEERDRVLARRAELGQRLEELAARERDLDARIRALEASDAYRAARDLDGAAEAARKAEELARAQGRRAGEDAEAARRAAERTVASAREVAACEAEAERARGGAAAAAKEAGLGALQGSLEALLRQGEIDGARAALDEVLQERREALTALRRLGEALSRAVEALARAEERARERALEVEAARSALAEAERALIAAEERWEDAFEAWARALQELPWPATSEQPSTSPPIHREELAIADTLREVERLAASRRDELAADRAAALAESQGLERERALLAEELAALAAAPHPVPAPPAWRAARASDRPGAPLYLLCEFGEAALGREAAIEAALEAAGLLDAWVEPGGVVLDPLTGDALLRAPAAEGRTLADVLVAVEARDVGVEAARAALAAIGFAEAGEEGAGATWVAADGRFRLGALTGAHAKPVAAFVGATAREAERARRMANLGARVEALAVRVAEAEGRAAAAAARQERLASELASVPPGREVDEAGARVDVRSEALSGAREVLSAAERAAAVAATARTAAASALDVAAVAMGLAAWARDPGALAERTRSCEVAAERWLAAAGALAAAARRAAADEEGARESGERHVASSAEARRARDEAESLRARAEALREAAGAAAEEVLRALAESRAAAAESQFEGEKARTEKSALDERKGAAEAAVETAERVVADSDGLRKEAGEALRALAADGLLDAASLGEGPGDAPPVESWSYTAALDAARRIDAAVEKGATDEQRAAAEDRLMRRQTELQGQLPPEMRIFPSRPRGVLSYEFSFGGRPRPAREVLAEIEGQVAARTALLGEHERELIEKFLSGETHDHLAARLREAKALVDRMNAALEGRATASGAQVRLVWEVDEAHAGARAAVALFLRAGRLLTEANREALEAFLHDRLARARDAEGTKPLQDRMLEALDYRPWHRFVVEHRAPGQAWAPLTRKAHASGSGGKKAVMLHLPLFAAAAAFYDAAKPAAPRLVALDEAFAGIDRPMRGQLMGLLAEFDLDFIMTSYEEWGFYAELDGLSTYHLSRDPSMRGVHAEWFLWNGREQVLVEES
jgi:uncharacterized protein (TIGR02680 family)